MLFDILFGLFGLAVLISIAAVFSNNKRAIDWKLVALSTSWELYDMSNDRSETKNLADKHPEKVEAMKKAWFQHAEEFHQLALQDLPKGASAKKGRKKAGKGIEE